MILKKLLVNLKTNTKNEKNTSKTVKGTGKI